MRPKLKFRNPIIHVQVTDKDWNDAAVLLKGGKWRYECCPNALACTRALKAKFRRHPDIQAIVTGNSILAREGETYFTYFAKFAVPGEATDVIIAFDGDAGKVVKTSYDLDLRTARAV